MISVVSRATCGFGHTGATRDGGGGVHAIWADGGETWVLRRNHGGGGVHAIWADGGETWVRRRRSCNLDRRSRDVKGQFGQTETRRGGGGLHAIWADGGETCGGGGRDHAIWADGVET